MERPASDAMDLLLRGRKNGDADFGQASRFLQFLTFYWHRQAFRSRSMTFCHVEREPAVIGRLAQKGLWPACSNSFYFSWLACFISRASQLSQSARLSVKDFLV
jgi:hypothetical protein